MADDISAADQRQTVAQSVRESGDNDIAVIMNVLLDRKWLIIGFFLAAAILSTLYVSQIRPQFISKAEILVESASTIQMTMPQAFVNSNGVDIVALRSHAQIIKSPGMVRRLIAQTDLVNDTEIDGDDDYDSFDSIPIAHQQKMVEEVMSRLSAKPVIGTALIEVSYRSDDPIKAAKIVNDVIRLYQAFEMTEMDKNATQRLKFLNERLDSLQNNVIKAETALDEAQQAGSIGDGKLMDLRLIQIDVLTKDLANTQTRLSELETLKSQIQEAGKNPQADDTLPSELSNSLTLSYKSDLQKLEQERARLGQKYGPNHPIMRANAREIAVTKAELKNENSVLRNNVEAEINIARENIEGLNEKIQAYQTSYQADAPSRHTLRDLEGEASAARALYNNFMGTYREALQTLDFQNSSIEIVSPAVPPIAASYPQKTLIIILCSLTGLFMGIFMALILEKLQNVFQSVGQLEKMTAIPVYGILPKAKRLKKQSPPDFIVAHTASGLAETVRSLYMSLLLRDRKDKAGGRVVTITSTTPGEGKSTISTWLGTIAAGSGKKVVIIDADMRRPSLHKKYDIGNARGISDYLSDRLPLDDIIYRNHPTGVHLMTAKAIPTHALTLITSERMQVLIRRLRDMYDLVIIDAPSSLIFSDARTLATLSDKTFYIVEWKKTKRDILLSSVKQFTDMGYRDMAFIMNKADIRQFAPGSSADMAYFYQSNVSKSRFLKGKGESK